MFHVAIPLLARKVGAKSGKVVLTRDFVLVSKSIAQRRAAIEKALRSRTAVASRPRRAGGAAPARRAPKPASPARKPRPARHARHAAKTTRKPRKLAPSTAAAPATTSAASKKVRKMFPGVSDTSSWVSVMSKALQKRIAQTARQQQHRQQLAARRRTTADAAVVAVRPTLPSASASIAAYEVKDQKIIDAIIAEALPRRGTRAGRKSAAMAVAALSSASALTPPAVIMPVTATSSSTPIPTTSNKKKTTAPSPPRKSAASPSSGLLPAPSTFLSRDWVELECAPASVETRLSAILQARADLVAPATPPSTRPLALRDGARVHLVHLDATNAYTQTLLAMDTMEKRVRAQLHAPIFDVSMTAEKVNPASRYRPLSPVPESSADEGNVSTDEVVLVLLTTCRPTEAAAIEAGWSAHYVETSEKPLFSVAQLRASASASASSPRAGPSIHLSSATVARVVVLNEAESRRYLAQSKARQSLEDVVPVAAATVPTEAATPVAATTTVPVPARPSKSTKAKRGAASTPAAPAAAAAAEASVPSTDASDDVTQLVETALQCALENTKKEIAVFVQLSVREAFTECEAVRQERHEVAWRRYQQRLLSQASRRRGARTAEEREAVAASLARQGLRGGAAPVFLEASQQQIDDAVSKAVDEAIGKLHSMPSGEKPE